MSSILGFLGFKVDWHHRFDDNAPLYRQMSRGEVILHLGEHHADGRPGARTRVMMRGVEEFQRGIIPKGYRYMRPELETTAWKTLETVVMDPFGNQIRFCEAVDPEAAAAERRARRRVGPTRRRATKVDSGRESGVNSISSAKWLGFLCFKGCLAAEAVPAWRTRLGIPIWSDLIRFNRRDSRPAAQFGTGVASAS
jgi:hypothetical protein